MATKPFPAITGRCHCGQVKYRLLTSPLFCFACHCPDCQKSTGSAFALHATIETFNISILSDAKPSLATLNNNPQKSGDSDTHNRSRRALCQQCGTVFWSNDGRWGYAVSDVRIGTLDFPGIMEPDLHSFVGSKLGWFELPKDAKSTKGHFNYKEVWPKSSLQRLELCLERFEAAVKATAAKTSGEEQVELVIREKNESPIDGDGDKTPTATGDAEDVEDDEAFEERVNGAERVLQERLAKLSLKLESEEKQTSSGTAI